MRDDFLQVWVLQILLAPVVLIYALVIRIRHFLYDYQLTRSTSFDFPIIGIGNLSLGGVGKTPHVEFLIRMLQPYITIGTLSRGYGRKSVGMRPVNPQDKHTDVGDEPLMLKRKFPATHVMVGESRVLAVPEMLKYNADTKAIILDDAFQHRAIQPFVNILLTEYENPFFEDKLFPWGRLRDVRVSAHRADILIFSKCPADIAASDRIRLAQKALAYGITECYFSQIIYGQAYQWDNPQNRITELSGKTVLLVSGIARPKYAIDFLQSSGCQVVSLAYEDHHTFTKNEIGKMLRKFEELESSEKIILTTEKDAMRLEEHYQYLHEKGVQIFLLPIAVKILFEEEKEFVSSIKNKLLSFKA